MRERKDPNRKPPVFVNSISPSRWKELFEAVPPLSQKEVAKIIGCSDRAAGIKRKAMGYGPAYPKGGARFTKFTIKDVLKIAKIRLPDEKVIHAAVRAGYTYASAKHISYKFKREFEQHQYK